MLGWLAYLDQKPDEALKHYARAEEIEPYNAKIHYQMGLARAQKGQFQQAVERFKKAIEIEPDHLDAAKYLCLTLGKLRRIDEAIAVAQRGVKRSKNRNIELMMILAETYAEAKQFSQAADIADQALIVAQSEQPAVAQQIRQMANIFRQRARE